MEKRSQSRVTGIGTGPKPDENRYLCYRDRKRSSEHSAILKKTQVTEVTENNVPQNKKPPLQESFCYNRRASVQPPGDGRFSLRTGGIFCPCTFRAKFHSEKFRRREIREHRGTTRFPCISSLHRRLSVARARVILPQFPTGPSSRVDHHRRANHAYRDRRKQVTRVK